MRDLIVNKESTHEWLNEKRINLKRVLVPSDRKVGRWLARPLDQSAGHGRGPPAATS